MTFTPPARPKIYHITNVMNLAAIIEADGLLSDAAITARGGPAAPIGMSTIKQRRLSLPVECHPDCMVGDFVPFYFSPRSVMLYVIACRNHAELAYRGGEEPILHLEADLHAVVAWASRNGRRWAFNWPAIAERNWSDPMVKEGKQAEFLVHGSLPWALVERIGVRSAAVLRQCTTILAAAVHKPRIEVQPSWYYNE